MDRIQANVRVRTIAAKVYSIRARILLLMLIFMAAWIVISPLFSAWNEIVIRNSGQSSVRDVVIEFPWGRYEVDSLSPDVPVSMQFKAISGEGDIVLSYIDSSAIRREHPCIMYVYGGAARNRVEVVIEDGDDPVVIIHAP